MLGRSGAAPSHARIPSEMSLCRIKLLWHRADSNRQTDMIFAGCETLARARRDTTARHWIRGFGSATESVERTAQAGVPGTSALAGGPLRPEVPFLASHPL